MSIIPLGVPLWCGLASLASLVLHTLHPRRIFLAFALLAVITLHAYTLLLVPAGWPYLAWRWLPMAAEALSAAKWERAFLAMLFGAPAVATVWTAVILVRSKQQRGWLTERIGFRRDA